MDSGTSGRLVNHSASAQLCSTALAYLLPLSAFSWTSWNWSNISRVFFRPLAACVATLSSASSSSATMRADVVAAQHGAQQLRGVCARDQRALFGAVGHGRQVAGLDLGGVVDAGRNAVGEQFDQEGFFALGRVLQQFDDFAGLLGGQRQRRDAGDGALGDVGAVGLQELGHHGFFLLYSKICTVDARAVVVCVCYGALAGAVSG